MKTKRLKKLKPLDYHEGLSENQCRLFLDFFKLDPDEFGEWMYGQTGPMIPRYAKNGKIGVYMGTYEYDLFRYIDHKVGGHPLIWD